MAAKSHFVSALICLPVLLAGCILAGEGGTAAPSPVGFAPGLTETAGPSPATAGTPSFEDPAPTALPVTPTQTAAIANTATPAPTEAEALFEVGKEITIQYLQDLEISGSAITFEEELDPTLYYSRHLVSYRSEGNRIFGLLTIPAEQPPNGGFKAIVFNHGYIPPPTYRTTERYTAYVDYLARSGFVVFKIDYRGHGQSEGEPTGTYFSPAYTIDAIAALKSLQQLDFIDPQGIGMWGHSMAGNLVLRAMLIEHEVQAGVIWAGAVYSYDDFVRYGIDDNTYQPPPTPAAEGTPDVRRSSREIFEAYGRPDTQGAYWQAVSLTENIEFLNRPLQLHHAEDDPVVNLGYALDLAAVLRAAGKDYELFRYESGGHNLISPYFDQAMLRTVEFFRQNL